MLDAKITKKIEDFVYSKPRSIQEISIHINKNWRTADRYIQEIRENFGTLETRTFREGTRGALKIVYWASIDKVSHSVFQEQLEKHILNAKTKEEFSPFDIFQHISDENKKARIEQAVNEESTDLNAISNLLKQTKNQLIIFSGNLSFINLKDKDNNIFKILEELIQKEVKIKIISRVDFTGKENIEKLLSLNHKYKKENIEIKHAEQPLRTIIFDNKVISFKEIRHPTGKINELNKKIFLFYEIKDKEWIEWLTKIFWKIFNSSISADKRLEEINKIKFK